jgi:hypothetical protein
MHHAQNSNPGIEPKLGKEMVFRVIGIMKEIGGTFRAEDDNSITIPLRVC